MQSIACWSYYCREDHKVGGLRRKDRKTEQIPFGYLECSYGPRNVRNRFRRDEILLSELKDTSKVHLSSEIGSFEVEVTEFDGLPLKSPLVRKWEIHWFSMEI